MKQEFSAEKLDIARFARANASLEGATPLDQMLRLHEEFVSVERVDDAPYQVQWSAHGRLVGTTTTQQQVWLDLSANALVPQTCQRCLQRVDFPIAFEHRYRFVGTEQEALVQDEWAEEDVLVLSKSLNLLNLIEDELLMALPLIPTHDTCPEALPLEAADPDFWIESDAPNPFGVLADLKKPKT